MLSKIFFLISGIRFTYKFVILDTKTKQHKIFVVFEILANVLLTLINWLLKPKCMLKPLFFWCMKNTIWFFSFETLGRMHKNIFFLFFNFFAFLEVLMKTGYFNTEIVFLWCKIQIDINKNDVEKYTGKFVTFWNKHLKFFKMGRVKPKYMGWPKPGPTTWAQPTLAGYCAWAQ